MIFMNFENANNIKYGDVFDVKDTFPEITLTHLPQEILIMIKRMYAGKKSEFTSLTQYMYQHFVIWSNPRLKSLANILEEIAIREMIHYEILAKILVKCGIDPKNCVYIDGNPNICDFWKASSVSYEKTLVKMFENNCILEQRSIDEYKEILNKTDNENLKQILSRIIEDEKSHLMYFTSVLRELKN